jgi:hypothetical protein
MLGYVVRLCRVTMWGSPLPSPSAVTFINNTQHYTSFYTKKEVEAPDQSPYLEEGYPSIFRLLHRLLGFLWEEMSHDTCVVRGRIFCLDQKQEGASFTRPINRVG